MRPILATVVMTSAFGILSPEVNAQYAPVYGPMTPTGYWYVQPNRPIYPYSYSVAAPRSVRPPNPTGYVNRPYYGAYGYGNDSNGSTDGFPPFRGRWSR